MLGRIAAVVVLLSVAGALVACTPASEPDSAPPVAAPSDGASGETMLAAGLYDLADGTVQAVGTLEFRDLEGGFWAVIGGTEAQGDQGTVVAVIANADQFASETEQLEGTVVVVEGRRLEGASIRMAGPEIEAASISVATEAIDPAQ